MADSYVPFQIPGTVDGKLDTESLTVGANTVLRERVQVTGKTATAIMTVKEYTNANPASVVLVDTNGDPYVASGASASPASTATRSAVADSATAVSLIAANGGRKGLVITNDSSARLFVGYGTVDPTTTDYTFVLLSGQTWEMAPGTIFTGQLKGIWETDPNDGSARITELTA